MPSVNQLLQTKLGCEQESSAALLTSMSSHKVPWLLQIPVEYFSFGDALMWSKAKKKTVPLFPEVFSMGTSYALTGDVRVSIDFLSRFLADPPESTFQSKVNKMFGGLAPYNNIDFKADFEDNGAQFLQNILKCLKPMRKLGNIFFV